MLRTLLTVIASASLLFGPALAEDESQLSMIATFELDPSKASDFDEGWADIRDMAEANGYAYAEFVGGMRNERWILTPLESYADVDSVIAARAALSEAGGKKFQKALAKFNGATVNSQTFFTRGDPDLSYQPEGASQGPFMEIDTHHFRYGEGEEMEAILTEWKALMEAKNVPHGYQVNWDGIGSQGNSITIVSYAENAVAMAEANAEMSAMMEDDKAAQALIDRFLKISTRSETMQTSFNPEASINLPENW